MPDMIRDGKGKGYLAQVTSGNQLKTQAETHELIFYQSFHNAETYTLGQVQSVVLTPSVENVLCHITNTSGTKMLCISHIHVGGYLATTGAYGFVRVYGSTTLGSSTGAAYTPVNHNRTSGNAAEATVRISNAAGSLTATGGAQACTKAISPESPTAEMSFNGSIILGLGDTADIRMFELAGGAPTVCLCVEGYYIDC